MRLWRVGVIAVAVGAGCVAPKPPLSEGADGGSTLVHEVKSDFSHIRVRDSGDLRSMYFVEPGLEVRQSSMLKSDPGRLVVPYTRGMFASMLVKRPQERVLIVGLGAGSMVRFLNRHFPRTTIDAVEIDPEVVRIADELFGTRGGGRTRIFTEDAFEFLRRDVGRYDAIYMDAFLEPGPDTDPRGIPQRLKTVQFLKSLRDRLTPGGVVAFNLSENRETGRDLAAISAAFPSVYPLQVPGTKNLVVIASTDPHRLSVEELRAAGRALDRKHRSGFSFEAMTSWLSR